MRLRSGLFILLGILSVGLERLHADVINFSSGLSGAQTSIPNGYAGFTWNNFNALNTQLYTSVMPSGYANAVTDSASPYVAFNLYGQPASLTSGTPFSFYGAFFTAAWRDNLQIDVQGYRNGVLLYNQNLSVDSTSPTFVAFNFQNIDTLAFTASRGIVHGYDPPGLASHPPLTQFALDDLIFTRSVSTPEPPTLVLIGSYLSLIVVYRRPWKRRRGVGYAQEPLTF